MSAPDLYELLRDCYVTSGRNVVAAGMVQSATADLDHEAPGASIPGVAPRYIARVAVRAAGSDEGANAQLAAQIENRLLGHAAISRAEVTLLPPLFPIL